MPFSVKIEGLKEVQKRFDALNQENIKVVLKKGLDSASKLVLARMKDNTPVDKGNLRDSEEETKLGELKTVVGPNLSKASYAGYVESGHFTRNKKSFVPGQFYIEKTAIEMTPIVGKLFRVEIVNAFRRK